MILNKVCTPRVFPRYAQGSNKGVCHDNAVAESFFNTLKRELVNEQTYKNLDEAKSNL